MAKQLIRQYIFTPGVTTPSPVLGTLEIPGKVDLGQLLVITNVTKGIIIYNFADSNFAGTTVAYRKGNTTNFPTATQNGDGTTLITLAANTVGHSSSDNIQIFVERGEVITRPWAMGTDAFERMRVANPQSMLDADFEYGLQPTKWQMIGISRATPAIYEIPGTDFLVTSVTTDASGGGTGKQSIESLITVVSQNPHNLSTGSVVTVQGLDNSVYGYSRAQGIMMVNSVTSFTSFNFYAEGQVSTATNTNLVTPYTVIRKGGFYTGSSSTFTTSSYSYGSNNTATVTLNFANNHGYVTGAGIFVVVTSDNGSNNHALAQGPFYIIAVTSTNALSYFARNVGIISGTITGYVYPRSDAFFLHRPFDGGAILGAGGPNHGSHAVRMSKKYIRYQSGKAINYNTAALFAPNFDIRSITATNTIVGSTIYITTDDVDHNMQIGATCVITGVSSTGFEGTYTVANVISENILTVTSTNVLSTTTAIINTPCLLQMQYWHGATVRAGTFDDQNGMFWQYDGTQMAAVLRSSTFQVAGTVTVTPGSTLITGLNTRFVDQLREGDRVVIKGMSHMIHAVTSSTWIYVNPPFRGISTSSGVKITKTNEIAAPQSQWNIDRCDGTNGVFNPSGYNLLPNKVQMIGLQWTWYGAGFIDWMLRGPDGNYIFCHRMKNSNINGEAYMRSGNMPVRYEVENIGAKSYLTFGISTSGSGLQLADVTYFPNSGTVLVDNELIKYNGKSASTGAGNLLNLTRGASITNFISGNFRDITAGSNANHNTGTGVLLVSCTATPSISHWGSAFLTDGGFDNDRGYIFNYQATNVVVSTRKTTAFAIRLAPSVSNATVGDLGVRDLINRAQLLLQSLEITAGGGLSSSTALVIEGVINPSNYPANPNLITWNTLQGSIQGGNLLGTGQPTFSQIATSNGITFDSTATISTTCAINTASGSTLISVASTASIAIGDAMINTSRPNTTQGNTIVTGITTLGVIINNPSLGGVSNGDTLTFYRNLWAQPGETIFSFISSPASKDSLDLTPLKELTNTPLGGRGTFPNGPDCLFINVYVTQGSPISANMVLRWGEAQA
jgi:hypothetical protein